MRIFGSVAELYETARPGYPPQLSAAIAGYHGGRPSSVVEIGAGTGKGTEILAAIGAPLTCIEPDPRMAALLTGRFPGADVHTGTFEDWSPPAGGVDMLACAMAWHWLDPVTRNALARRALAPTGTLAIFGHRYDYADPDQRDAVQAVLHAVDPPARERPVDWFHQDVLDSGEFTGVRKEVIRRNLPLNREQYLALVRTFGPFLSRTPEQQRAGLTALGRLIDDCGGTIVLDLRTTLVLARPAGPDQS
jgi:SAM-dependent methyltransferase